MKQRITYFVPEGHGIDPNSIYASSDTLSFTGAKGAAVEKRVTVGLSELPDELSLLFEHIHELHIRWSSQLSYNATSPILSRLPPGLHAFFTPRNSDREIDVCPLLKQLFSSDLKCDSVSTSFSTPPILSERFSAAATFQYYHELPRLLYFQAFLARNFCNETEGRCFDEVQTLSFASSVDIDYDAISHAVVLTAFWRPNIAATIARTLPRKWRESDSLEVGILESETPEEPEELKLGGYLTVVGEDEKPSPTLFSFPSRHHGFPNSTFSVHFKQPTGLHPTLSINFPSTHSLSPPDPSCALHAYFTLPSPLFLDRYQFSDPLFLASHNLASLRAISGEDDLEAPDWVVRRWGSAALLELSRPENDGTVTEWTATVPMHLRYLQSSSNSTASSYTSLEIPWPALFYACPADEGLKFATNPFDRVNLGYEGLFGPKTMFYHLSPELAAGEMVELLKVPVLGKDRAGWVPTATFVAVVLGFGWVVWKLGMGAWTQKKGSMTGRSRSAGAKKDD